MKRFLSAAALLCIAVSVSPIAAADKPSVVDVWPGKAPGDTGKIGQEKTEESGARQAASAT